MKTLAEARIAVIGLGLMGGSLAAALRGRCAQITLYEAQISLKCKTFHNIFKI